MDLRRYRRLYRLLSCTTMIGFLMPILAAMMVSAPAKAQGQAPMQVGVVEFRNDSGVQGELLARFATDAVVIELSKSNRFDVITRAQIEAYLKELGLTPPLPREELSRLGDALGADAMIEGAIKAVELRGSGATRRAAVTIVVRMVDQPSGEVINGAVQSGFSSAKVGQETDDDKLIAEAIDNAAYAAVKTIQDYIIPEATVLNTIGSDQVLLNRGARDGLRNGMRMIVTREKEIIGELSIRDVQPDNATAFITKHSRGIRPEDKARAVFDMPEVSKVNANPSTKSGSPPTTSKKNSSIKTLGKVVLGLGAVYLLTRLFTSHGEDVGAVSAESGLSGYSLPTETGAPGVRIKWNNKKLSKGLNVVEYHVWRNDVAGPVVVSNPIEGVAFDTAVARTVAYDSADPITHKKGSGGSTSVPAMILGRPYKYYVSALYVVNSADGQKYYETDRAETGQATPLMPMGVNSLREPNYGSMQDLHKVIFRWLSTQGADEYVIEASVDPNFKNPEYISNSTFVAPGLGGQLISLDATEKFYNAFKGLKSDQPIWWRVGMRCSTDTPGPIPAAGRSNVRFIFSDVSMMKPVEMPPDPLAN